MSESKDWSPSYTAWKLMEVIVESRSLKLSDLGKEQLLDLFSDCVNSVQGEYIADIVDIDDDDFDDDDLDIGLDDDDEDDD